MSPMSIVFVSYAESVSQLRNIYRLAESLRTFGGKFGDAPVWAYIPHGMDIGDLHIPRMSPSPDVEIRSVYTPEEARWVFYAGKVYAAAEAEKAAAGNAALMVFIDEDTIILSEPQDFDLEPQQCLAYCPVMHNRSGSLYDAPPDKFWGRIYEKLAVADDLLFPMVTPADQQKIRAYFHVGLLVVRPKREILRRWAGDFEVLYTDPVLAEMCKTDNTKRVFLHQTAIVGAVLKHVARDEMLELSGRYNYPIFFERRYESKVTFNSIENVITLRCVIAREDLESDWYQRLAGPSDKVAWVKERLFPG